MHATEIGRAQFSTIVGEEDMGPYDLKSNEDWQRLLTSFSEETGMAAALFNSENKILVTAADRNAICRHIREKPETLGAICSMAQQNLAMRAQKTKTPVTDFCDAGLLKTVIPIFYKGQYLGGITACGSYDPNDPIELQYISEMLEVPEEHLRTRKIRESSYEKVREITKRYHRRMKSLDK